MLLDIIDLLANHLFHCQNLDLSWLKSNGFIGSVVSSGNVPAGLTNRGKVQ
jgi:hypothetical protein